MPAKGHRARVYGLVVLCCWLLLLTACHSGVDAWSRIQESGVLRVGLDPTFPPFELDDGLGLHGFDVDLARALGEALGLEVAFVYFGYDGLYDALATEQVDVLLSALVVDPARMRDFAYSEPYFNAGQILVTPAGETAVRRMADLANGRLAVELGAQGHVEAITWSRRLAGLTVQPYDSPAAALTAVAQQEADAALVDSISGRLFIKEQGGLQWLPDPVTVEPYALVVRAADRELLQQVDNGLERLRENGRLAAIERDWFGE